MTYRHTQTRLSVQNSATKLNQIELFARKGGTCADAGRKASESTTVSRIPSNAPPNKPYLPALVSSSRTTSSARRRTSSAVKDWLSAGMASLAGKLRAFRSLAIISAFIERLLSSAASINSWCKSVGILSVILWYSMTAILCLFYVIST
jgi:hypothetical protein